MAVAIPVNMRTGLFRVEPFVILVDTGKTALVHIDKKRYDRIVAPHRHGTYLDRLAGIKAVFAEYADKIAEQPLDRVVAQHPKSIVIGNGQVKSFRLYIDSDANRGRRASNYTFEIVAAPRKKYRGNVDRAADVPGKATVLKEIFGERLR